MFVIFHQNFRIFIVSRPAPAPVWGHAVACLPSNRRPVPPEYVLVYTLHYYYFCHQPGPPTATSRAKIERWVCKVGVSFTILDPYPFDRIRVYTIDMDARRTWMPDGGEYTHRLDLMMNL